MSDRPTTWPVPTVEALLECVHRHYPAGVQPDDPQHGHTEESRRLVCVQEAAARRCKWQFYDIPDHQRVALDPEVQGVVDALRAWRPFADRWRQAMPDCLLWDESNPWHDASYRYSALEPGYVQGSGARPDEVVCRVSALAPVYVIYTHISVSVPVPVTKSRFDAFHERYRVRGDRLAALVEEMFGFHRVGERVVSTPVPDVAPIASNMRLGEATLMDCLFTTTP